MMKNILKTAAAIAVVLPSLAMAQQLIDETITVLGTSNQASATGNISVLGDGGNPGGGTGWVNVDRGNNTTYNELDLNFRTAAEVYVSVETNHAMAVTKAAHLGGKGAVFVLTTAGFTGQCSEDVAAVRAADGNIAAAMSYSGITGSFVNNTPLPTGITAATPIEQYKISGCQVVGA